MSNSDKAALTVIVFSLLFCLGWLSFSLAYVQDNIEELKNRIEKLEQKEMKGPFYVGRAKCTICTHVWIAQYPTNCDEEQLECPSCTAQDSEIEHQYPPEDIEEVAAQINLEMDWVQYHVEG